MTTKNDEPMSLLAVRDWHRKEEQLWNGSGLARDKETALKHKRAADTIDAALRSIETGNPPWSTEGHLAEPMAQAIRALLDAVDDTQWEDATGLALKALAAHDAARAQPASVAAKYQRIAWHQSRIARLRQEIVGDPRQSVTQAAAPQPQAKGVPLCASCGQHKENCDGC